MRTTLLLPLLLSCSLLSWSQQMIVSSSSVKMTGGNLVIQDMNFVNNGTFMAADGNVRLSGDVTTNISGTAEPVFARLTIDKSNVDIQMGQNATVGLGLEMQGGHVYVNTSDLQLMDPATVSGATSTQHIKTTSTGTLTQAVADGNVTYPVGNSSYNPVILNNNGGTADNYAVRVSDATLANGTSGKVITSYVVDRTWHVSESVGGGSNLDITPHWSTAEQLGFTDGEAVVANYDGGWNELARGTPSTSLGLNSLSGPNTSTVGEFAVFEDRSGYTVPYECADTDLSLTTTIDTKKQPTR